MKKNLLVLMTLFTAIILHSQTFIVNNITYSVTSTANSTVAVTDYNTNGGTAVVIPDSVTPAASGKLSSSSNAANVLATYNITSIAANAFNSKGLTSVVIGNNVITIGTQAFTNNYLNTATIGNSVTTIGFNAFFNSNLTSVVIPNSVTTIEGRAFDDNLLTRVIIGTSVTSIGLNAFRANPLSCITSLATIPPTIITGTDDSFGTSRNAINLVTPAGTSNAYASATWTGFNTSTETVALAGTFVKDYITYQVTSITNKTLTAKDYNTAGGTNVNIPATVKIGCDDYNVTVIGNNAFMSNGLTSVIIPNTVTTINTQAFFNNSITTVTIPASVTTIGHNAFGYNGMTSVLFSNGLVNIGTESFRNNNLSSVTIPDSVTNIDDAAFVQNNNLTVLTLGNSVETIGQYAFRYTNLNSVTLPDSVNSVDTWAFGDSNIFTLNLGNGIQTIGDSAFINNHLENITISNSVETIGNNAFYSSSTSRSSIVLGNNLTTIGSGAFISGTSSSITSITIPSSVTSIGNNAFPIPSLTDVISLATTPATIITGSNDTFAFSRIGIHLHIPTGTTGVYVSNPGALWTGFSPVTEDALLSTSGFELSNDIKVITTSDTVTIISSDTVRLEKYTLYNISGSEVGSGVGNVIPTSTLPNGIYIVKLNFDQGTVVKKIAK